MKYLLTLIFLFFTLSLFPTGIGAQTKGVSPVDGGEGDEISETYAVVVGISDYQDEGIPDLRFADKDALAFAGFLQSPAGGSLDEDHLKVLINKEATVAQFAIALDWLLEVAKENDRVLVYFSGHGDVERKTITQPGYLLCWDAPSKIYLAGGALALPMFQDVITTLSAQNKAKVIVITDACRSGKLSGSSVGGAQITGSNLARQYANEIKILSCQPDEYSIEGEQWGGGRGAFSYHLLDGLYGMADGNSDASVNLKEIGRYLEDRVSEEVAPQNQNPMTIGNVTEKLTDVFPGILEELKEGKKGQMQLFTATETKGIEDEVLAAADTNVVEMYLAFKKALDDKQFLFAEKGRPENEYADYYYEKLTAEPSLQRLHSSMRRNYSAALQDDAQQVLNKLLESNPLQVNQKFYSTNKNYKDYPKILRRAAGLLGEQHYMYKTLMARSYWFEGYINDNTYCYCQNIENGSKVIAYYKKALAYEPEMPHAWLQLADVYAIQMRQLDSADYYSRLAVESVPGWIAAYYKAAGYYVTHLTSEKDTFNRNGAKYWLDEGLAIDPNSSLLLSESGDFYRKIRKYKKAEDVLNRSLALDTTAQTLLYLGRVYSDIKQYDKAENVYLEAVRLDSSYLAQIEWELLFYGSGQDDKARKFFNHLIELDIQIPRFYADLGGYIKEEYPEEGIAMLIKSLERDSNIAETYKQLFNAHSFLEPIDTVQELRLIRKALQLAPEKPIYHINIGTCYLRQNQFNKAKESFLYARSLDSLSIYSYVDLYILYLQNDMYEEAVSEIKNGMAINVEKFTEGLFLLLHRYLQRPETAHIYFEKVASLYPDEPLVNYYFAMHYCFFEKDVEAAFTQLEKALQKGYSYYRNLEIETKLRLLWFEEKRWDALMKKYFPDQYKD